MKAKFPDETVAEIPEFSVADFLDVKGGSGRLAKRKPHAWEGTRTDTGASLHIAYRQEKRNGKFGGARNGSSPIWVLFENNAQILAMQVSAYDGDSAKAFAALKTIAVKYETGELAREDLKPQKKAMLDVIPKVLKRPASASVANTASVESTSTKAKPSVAPKAKKKGRVVPFP